MSSVTSCTNRKPRAVKSEFSTLNVTDRRDVQLTSPFLYKTWKVIPKVFCFLTRWIGEINPTDLGNDPSGVSG